MDGQTEHEIIAQHVTFEPVCEGWLGLPELPSSGELNPSSSAEDLSKAVVTSLGRNDVTTAYESKDEYLETNYRLNREEGVALLRSGVREYKESPWMMDNSSTLVYTKVCLHAHSCFTAFGRHLLTFLSAGCGDRLSHVSTWSSLPRAVFDRASWREDSMVDQQETYARDSTGSHGSHR